MNHASMLFLFLPYIPNNICHHLNNFLALYTRFEHDESIFKDQNCTIVLQNVTNLILQTTIK